MSKYVFSFGGVLVIAAVSLLALAQTGLAQTHLAGQPPVYQPPLSSMPNFGYYNPGPSYYPRAMAYPSLRQHLGPAYGWNYHLYYDILPQVDKILSERPPVDLTAHITLKVPAGAELSFNGQKIEGEGAVRKFYSPPLKPGQRYSYQVALREQKDGKLVTQTRKVIVTAGAHFNVDFTLPEASGK
jgi:uncharacterized protein (TIGR03000 family)